MVKKYLNFMVIEEKPKTKVYSVNKEDGSRLGIIYWYGAWRQYIFQPTEDTIWNTGCLKEIINFIEALMRKRRIENRGKTQRRSILP